MTEIIGTSVIVRSRIAGVHAGKVEAFNPGAQTIVLTNAGSGYGSGLS